MTGWSASGPLSRLLLIGLVVLVGCASLADPSEESPSRGPSPPASVTPGVVVLPVFNGTGRSLRVSGEERLGILEPVFSPRDPLHPIVPEFVQAGFILGVDAAGHPVATMAWTNGRVPAAPESIEAAWEVASSQRLDGEVVWIALTAWDASDWRQRGTITVSAEVARFRPAASESLRVRVFRRYPMGIPPFSSVAQAAGHIGFRLAQLTATR